MFGERPVIDIGLVSTASPAVAAVGVGLPAGVMIYSQLVAVLLFVHPKDTVVESTLVMVKAVGFGQVGGGAQVILVNQPGLFTWASLLNLKVKQPSGLDDVKGPGIAVPQ